MSNFEVLLVDNGSTDGSLEAVRTDFQSVRLTILALNRNLGFAAANNLAAAVASGQWIALLNPDAFPEPGWLEHLLAAAVRHPQAALFGSTQIDARDPGRFDGLGDCYFAIGLPWRGGYGLRRHGEPAVEAEVFSPCAAAALYRTDLFRALGGFDERFFCYVEDIDLGFRFRLAGWTAVQAAQAVVHHVGGGASSRVGGFARYHGTRNLVWAFIKNMPGPLFWPLLPCHVAALAFLAVRAALRGEAGPVLCGIRDAMRGLPAIWRDRVRLQAHRRVSWIAVARSLTWYPGLYWKRGVKRIGVGQPSGTAGQGRPYGV